MDTEQMEPGDEETTQSSDLSQSTSTDGTDTGSDSTDTADSTEAETEAVEAAPDEGTEDAQAEEAEEEYAPNTKYKVDGKEYEFDEKLKPYLTKETEPLFRELVEKAHGIDAIKTRHNEVKTERDTLQGQLGAVVQDVRGILECRDNGLQGSLSDFDNFFEATKIPFQNLVNYVYAKLKNQEALPQEHRGVYDENRNYRNRLRDADRQLQTLQGQVSDVLVQARTTELETTLSQPQIKEIADDIDSRIGTPGSFRQGLIEYAASRENATQRPVTVKDAVDGYLRLLGRPQGQAMQSQSSQGGGKGKTVSSTHKPKTIPNVGASSMSPTAAKPKSIKELRELGKSKIHE